MKKFGVFVNRGVLWYLLLGLPLVILNWACVDTTQPWVHLPRWLAIPLHELAFYWFLALLFFVIRFSTSGRFRSSFATRLAAIKERDEREVQIVGEAAKRALLFGVAILVVGLFFSLLRVQLTHSPPDQGSLSIGIGTSLSLDQFPQVKMTDGHVSRLVLDFLPQSLAPFLMVFLLAQLAIFRVHARVMTRGKH